MDDIIEREKEKIIIIIIIILTSYRLGTCNYLMFVIVCQCGHESCREDTFLDIPLVIKPFGMTVTYKSVQEALTAFVEPETLEGDNQVRTLLTIITNQYY